MMCVLVIMAFMLVRTDSPMCLSFWRQMFSRLVTGVDSKWGKRTAWAVCCSLLFQSLFLFLSLLSSLFPSLGCLLGRSLTDHISCWREAPWPSKSILLCHLSEHRRRLRAGLWTPLSSAALQAVWWCFASSHVIPAADWAWCSCLQAVLHLRHPLYRLKLSARHQIPFLGFFCVTWCSLALIQVFCGSTWRR